MDTKDSLAPRVREFVEKANARPKEFRDLNLAEFDAGLEGQALRVWVNAPSAVREALADLDAYNTDAFYALLAVYTEFDAAQLRDLFDAWDDALRQFVVVKIFQMLAAYRDERLNFSLSLRKDSTTTNSPPLA